jgi:phosphoribosyl-ATP pyrophosphohydrolase/phosphoribosyl-AMP cyclohydrolase
MASSIVPDFSQSSLLPAVVQHHLTGRVLMVGFMNQDAWNKTLDTKSVTFFSRSRNTLWTKGETSGNTLTLERWAIDCDADTILIHARPSGPTCHTGAISCFDENGEEYAYGFVGFLEQLLAKRKSHPISDSYTSKLFEKGIDKIAQKVGEEAVETVIAAKNENHAEFVGEASDLLFHLLVLLTAKGVRFEELLAELDRRHKPR